MPVLTLPASTGLLTLTLTLAGCLPGATTPDGESPASPQVVTHPEEPAPAPRAQEDPGNGGESPAEESGEPGSPDHQPRTQLGAGGALDGSYLEAEIATVGFDRLSGAPIVLLRELGSGQVVPIWVGMSEARAIALALRGMTFPRPLTHDLMVDLMEELDAELEEVVVHDLVDGTYYGLLKLKRVGSEEPLLVDTRPSDGLALAARTGALISIAQKILDETPDFDFLAPQDSEQVLRLSGLTLVLPTEAHRREMKLPDRPGVLITRATGKAARQGLQRGDLILEVEGKAVKTPMELLEVIRETPPGEPLEIEIWSEGEERTLELYLDRTVPGDEPGEPPLKT